MRKKMSLRHAKCVEDFAGQSRIPPMKLVVSDVPFEEKDILLAVPNVALGFLKMLPMHGPIHNALLAIGGSAISLSATDAY